MVIEVNSRSPEPRKIRRAVEALRGGGIIAYPTDTCYGLGCDPFNKKAVESLYRMKGMPRTHRLSFVCQDIASVARYAMLHDREYRILRDHLPGPYCFILEASREVPKAIQTKRRQIGVRVPNHAICQALVAELGGPLISSTAAQLEHPPHVDPREIELDFPGVELVLDGGLSGSVPTTVVDLTGATPEVLREGAGDTAPFLT